MQFTQAPISGVWICEPHLFEDHRGYFFESFNLQDFQKATGLAPNFVQDNQSRSFKGVMRGLHFQKYPEGQAKLVRVLEGEIQDVIVDMRPNSPTLGQSFSIMLSAQNRKQLYIPRGFAHGFLVLSEEAEFFYKCDNFYMPEYDTGIFFADPALNIEWQYPINEMKVSEKDQNLKYFEAMAYQ
ncbi:MAG: dTDP-4-dehydrorhamnose 3,5-epimerase [Bernardetiaceae bacterium]|nr:dTDP-4-dehydrorhamnose 3,5-epimerase [Bernardetiaceae bacterium]